ncbi:Transcriptional regulator, MerR family, associated with photolyase [Photobacterium marinum]|uniref:Transcriptional regulator, MerR family, associated with photolyase n=1 Tax=Photobacterium marinum TaxID=1056511 RepID=L8JE82_9GAMM|nr:MerR family transcriptional regulator [Photobacterium marinum]ELR65712.1 Transcriptional regulator, MerR family, associated with photolyase [Photobacterium marinum]
MDCESPNYSIKEVSEKTGVNPVTLRAWQRRYGLLNPQRTEKGHRLYSENDIEKIQRILSWLEKGVAIGKVRPLIEGTESRAGQESKDTEHDEIITSIMAALSDCNRAKLDRLLIQVMKEYPAEVFINRVVNMVEKQINQPTNPLSNIQASLWQSVLIERNLSLIAQSRKLSLKPCYLLSFDKTNSYKLWLKAWKLTDDGYSVTVMPELSGKLTALNSVFEKANVAKVVLYGNTSLNASDMTQLELLLTNLKQKTECDIKFAGDISRIHKDFITSCNA